MADDRGNPTTLLEWRNFWRDTIHGGEVSGGVRFLDAQIEETGGDGNQPGDTVIAAESQMFFLLAQFDREGAWS